MNKYLEGYLKSIPKSEQIRITTFVENILKTKTSENNFYDLIKTNPEFVEYKKILDVIKDESVTTKQIDIKENDKTYDTYNEFFKRVYVDLLYLYQIIEALYGVKENYHSLISSYMTDMNNETKRLEDKLFELRTRNTIPYGHIVINETFVNNESFHGVGEAQSKMMSTMFIDRDGSMSSVVENAHYNSESMICLSQVESFDMIHNEAGKTMAHIELLDYRGVPITTFNTIENAIDMSNFTYWDCSTMVNDHIKVRMDDFEEGGAYVKFKISLPKIRPISEISIEPFCNKPVEICSIKINGIKYGDNVTKVHEILNEYESMQKESVSTMVYNFTQISGDYIEIVMRQKNYTLENQVKKEKYSIAEGLLKDALGDRTISYMDGEENIHTIFEKAYEDYMIEWNKEYMKKL